MRKEPHTPGPWVTAANGAAATLVRSRNRDTGQRICETFVTHGTLSREGNLKRIRENEANARLIAAAPDLLMLVQRFKAFAERGEHFCFPPGSLQEIEQIIAKVDG